MKWSVEGCWDQHWYYLVLLLFQRVVNILRHVTFDRLTPGVKISCYLWPLLWFHGGESKISGIGAKTSTYKRTARNADITTWHFECLLSGTIKKSLRNTKRHAVCLTPFILSPNPLLRLELATACLTQSFILCQIPNTCNLELMWRHASTLHWISDHMSWPSKSSKKVILKYMNSRLGWCRSITWGNTL